MAFCRQCGAQIPDHNLLCPYCGTETGIPTPPPYQQPYYQSPYQAPYQPIPQQSSSASIVLGIIGIVSAWLLALAGHVTSIIGIVLGVKEYRATGKVTGLVLSIIGEVCSIASSLLGVIMMSGLY